MANLHGEGALTQRDLLLHVITSKRSDRNLVSVDAMLYQGDCDLDQARKGLAGETNPHLTSRKYTPKNPDGTVHMEDDGSVALRTSHVTGYSDSQLKQFREQGKVCPLPDGTELIGIRANIFLKNVHNPSTGKTEKVPLIMTQYDIGAEMTKLARSKDERKNDPDYVAKKRAQFEKWNDRAVINLPGFDVNEHTLEKQNAVISAAREARAAASKAPHIESERELPQAASPADIEVEDEFDTAGPTM